MTVRHRLIGYAHILLMATLFVLALHVLLILFTGGYTVRPFGATMGGRRVTPPIILMLVLLILRLPLRHRTCFRDVFSSHRAVILFSLFLLIYLANDRTIGSGDTLPARFLPLSILREADFDLDEFPSLYARGTPYYLRFSGGHYVSSYPVGAALLALPFYLPSALGQVAGSSPLIAELEKVAAATIVAASAVILHSLLRLLTGPAIALLIAATYALGTSSLSVSSQALWQHGPSQLALTAAIYCLVRARREPRWVAPAGFCLAFAVVCRPSDLLIALPLGVHVLLHHRRQAAGFLCAALPPILFQVWYNIAYFGDPLRTQVPLAAGRFWTSPSWEGVAGVLLSPARGLFVYSPVFLLSVIGMGMAWRKNGDPLLRHLSVGVVLTIFLYSMWVRWHGGHTFGPRLLADLTPVLALFLYPLSSVPKRRHAFRAIYAVALAWSIGAHAIGAFWDNGLWNVAAQKAAGDASGFGQRMWSWTDNQLVDPARALRDGLFIAARGLPTSRKARHLLAADYRGNLPQRISLSPGERIRVVLEATNVGQAVWLARARREKGAVRLGWRWFRDGNELAGSSGRLPIRHDVFPGQAYHFDVAVDPPREPGTYVLELSLVSEYVVWFSDVGTPPLRLPVNVQEPSP